MTAPLSPVTTVGSPPPRGRPSSPDSGASGACILGLDPSFTAFGWIALPLCGFPVLAGGVLRTAPSAARRRVLAVDDNVRRAREIYLGLRAVMNRFDVRVVCAESFQHPRNSSAAAKVALAWGQLIALSEERQIPLLQASPQEVKAHMCGDKSASKDDVAAEVRKVLGDLDPMLEADLPDGLFEHVYDAAASALACMSSDVVRALRRAA